MMCSSYFVYVTIKRKKGDPLECEIACHEDGSGDGQTVECSITNSDFKSISTLDELIELLRNKIIIDQDDQEHMQHYFTEDRSFVKKLRREVMSLEKINSIDIALTEVDRSGEETTIDEIHHSFAKTLKKEVEDNLPDRDLH